MSRIAFEEMLKRRTSRRLALKAGTAGLIGVSFRGAPTRTFARQSATPKATPIDLTNRPSKTFGAYPFQLGVASGDPFPHSVVLWTRLAPAPYDGGGMDPVPYDVHWEVARDESFKNIVQAGRAVADPIMAYSVHVDVTGLDFYTEFFCRFMVGDGAPSLHDVLERFVPRDLPMDIVGHWIHAPAVVRRRSEAGPQHHAVREGIAGGHAKLEGIGAERFRRAVGEIDRGCFGCGRLAREGPGGRSPEADADETGGSGFEGKAATGATFQHLFECNA